MVSLFQQLLLLIVAICAIMLAFILALEMLSYMITRAEKKKIDKYLNIVQEKR